MATAGGLLDGCERGAIVTTAEAKLKENSRDVVLGHSTLTALGRRNLEFFDLDVRPSEELTAFDFIYFAGGNPFYLLTRMRDTNADSVLENLIAASRPVIAVSASTALLGRSLRPLRMFDSSVPDFGCKDHAALGMVPFAVLPHANRWHARFANYAGRLAAARVFCHCEIAELLDGEGLLVEGNSIIHVAEQSLLPVAFPSIAPVPSGRDIARHVYTAKIQQRAGA